MLQENQRKKMSKDEKMADELGGQLKGSCVETCQGVCRALAALLYRTEVSSCHRENLKSLDSYPRPYICNPCCKRMSERMFLSLR